MYQKECSSGYAEETRLSGSTNRAFTFSLLPLERFSRRLKNLDIPLMMSVPGFEDIHKVGATMSVVTNYSAFTLIGGVSTLLQGTRCCNVALDTEELQQSRSVESGVAGRWMQVQKILWQLLLM